MIEEASNARPHGGESSVSPVQLQKIEGQGGTGSPLFGADISLIKDIKVGLEVFVGRAEVSVGELFALKVHSVVKLDSPTDAAVEIRLDGKSIARGSLVVVDDNLGVSIDEILAASH